MARTKMIAKKASPALHSAPMPGAGIDRKTKPTTSTNATIFRLLRVPKHAKRTVASLCERKNDELMDELNRLKEDWMAQEREIEWLRKELERAKGELEAVRGRDSFGTMMQVEQGPSKGLSRSEEEDFEELWACYGNK